MENRKGMMPGTRSNKRGSSSFPTNGDYSPGRSAPRMAAMRSGRSEKHSLTRAERLHQAHERATAGPAGFHGSKRGKDVQSGRPSSSKPTRHAGRQHKGPGYYS